MHLIALAIALLVHLARFFSAMETLTFFLIFHIFSPFLHPCRYRLNEKSRRRGRQLARTRRSRRIPTGFQFGSSSSLPPSFLLAIEPSPTATSLLAFFFVRSRLATVKADRPTMQLTEPRMDEQRRTGGRTDDVGTAKAKPTIVWLCLPRFFRPSVLVEIVALSVGRSESRCMREKESKKKKKKAQLLYYSPSSTG